MAKKFGKFLLCTAAIGSAVAAVYYCVHKKKAEQDNIEEEDYDDFSEDSKEDSKKDSDTSRSYVPLNPDASSEDAADAQEAPSDQECSHEEPKEDKSFTPLAENAAKDAEAAEETVEAFFDEEDAAGEEPPISEG